VLQKHRQKNDEKTIPKNKGIWSQSDIKLPMYTADSKLFDIFIFGGDSEIRTACTFSRMIKSFIQYKCDEATDIEVNVHCDSLHI
jgi:hypothetical protein